MASPSIASAVQRTLGIDLDQSFGMSITTPIMPSPSFGSLEAMLTDPLTEQGVPTPRQRSGASNPATPGRSRLLGDISLDPIHLSFELGMDLEEVSGDLGIDDVDMSSMRSNGGGGEGGDAPDVEGEIDEDVWIHMYQQLQIYHHLYSHANVSPSDHDPALEWFVSRIRRGRSHLTAVRLDQLRELSFQFELDADDADWYNSLQAIHRHISVFGAHRLDEIEDRELLSWLGIQRTGYLGLDHAGVAHDVIQTTALENLGLDWQSLSLDH